MDDFATESGASEDAAAEAFGNLLDPQPKEESDDKEVEAKAEAKPESGDEPAEEDQEETERYKVKVNGKEIEVSLPELLATYQKETAANEKFEQAAEIRKTASAEIQKATQERQQAAQQLQQAELVLRGQLAEQPNWDALLQADPVQYLRVKQVWEQKHAQLNAIQAQQQNLSYQAQIEEQKNMQAFLAEQADALHQALPDWKDPVKGLAERQALSAYLKKQGYGDEELNNFTRAKDVLISRKAMLYDALMSKAAKTTEKVEKLPPQKVMRSGTTPTSTDGRTKQMQALRRSGSTADAASIFEKMI
jgi:hypothetical protein